MARDRISDAQAVFSAIKAGDLARCMKILDADSSLLSFETPFGPWLHVAASHGQLEIVKGLISRGADVNLRGGTAGGTAIHRAASDGRRDVVEFLLEHGASLDTSEPDTNPLFGAVYGGHLAIVELLVGSGIDYRVKYSGQRMHNVDAAEFARLRGETEIYHHLKRLN